MREIQSDDIVRAVQSAVKEISCRLPPDTRASIERAALRETSTLGRSIFADMLENMDIAAAEGIPVCQDTGMAVIFAELGQDAHITGAPFEDALNEGVRRGAREGYLRCSVVSDPLRRTNTGDNTPAVIHVRIVPGNTLRLVITTKGFGSENMGALRMFNPSASSGDIVDFVERTVAEAGGNPCPPVVVGVGIGGTMDKAAALAKYALTRETGCPSPEGYYAALEQEMLQRVNALGVGPQGFGGSITALAVHIETYPTHIAGLPVAVNLNCHVNRHAVIEL